MSFFYLIANERGSCKAILDHEIKELKGIEELGTKWQIRDDKTMRKIFGEFIDKKQKNI